MARLLMRIPGSESRVLELHLGVNRLGRSPENDFQIEHPTVSAYHCEVLLSDGRLLVRDCDSTNGTFAVGERLKEACLVSGQTFRIGDVELLVESTDVAISIPRFDMPRPAPPPVMLTDGGCICPRHATARVSHRCTNCLELMCDDCVRRLRRRGGKYLKLCPLCSHRVEPTGGEKKKKKSFLGMLQKTVKLPFMKAGSRAQQETL